MATESTAVFDKMPALHIGFLQKVADGEVLHQCACELGIDCTPFSKLGTNVDFCNPFTIPQAICFERLGIVVYRPGLLLPAVSTLFSQVFVEPGFQLYRAADVVFSPSKIGAIVTNGEEAKVDPLWGLRETGVLESNFDGDGIRVCVIDSGLEPHPDILLRSGNARSFTQGVSTGDDLGHGTFNAGIICGSANPKFGPRYGVAPKVELFVAKVFGPAGRACTVSLLAAIEWALQNNCEIISMSIGARASGTANPNGYMSKAARRALSGGTLIIAGAGNDSNRLHTPPILRPVSFPANCAGVMAVGALQPSLQMTITSNVTRSGSAGAIDIAAPGADIRSAGLSQDYSTAMGTSIATPYVAGIAALYAQACKGVRGQALWDLVVAKADPLSHLHVDEVGAGIVRAPLKNDACLCEAKPPCS